LAVGKTLAKIFLLLLLIAIVAAFGLVWFDYLGVIDIKTTLAPVYRLLGLDARSSPAPLNTEDAIISLDAERLAVRLEALSLQADELARQQADVERSREELEQISAENETRQKALDDRERTMNSLLSESEIKDRNVDQNARYLNGMPPADAVAIIAEMDDQDAIDVFRKLEEISAASGTASTVSYWLSLLPDRQRAAALFRKMSERP
jgi:flagellar protein FlbB